MSECADQNLRTPHPTKLIYVKIIISKNNSMLQLTPAQTNHCQAVVTALQRHQTEITPVLRTPYAGTTPLWFNFGADNTALHQIDMAQPEQLQGYIANNLQSAGLTFGVGRYNEDRVLYRQSNLFQVDGAEARSVHLAYDLWLPIGTPLYAPLAATVHSIENNDRFLDYGATIILEHVLDDVHFFSLYGHLALNSLTGKTPGQAIAQGEQFAWIGNTTENGQWAPHVHAQIICDMLGNSGDFPGVARPSERDYYTTLCPDPSLLFTF